jgi:hypothetical protein
LFAAACETFSDAYADDVPNKTAAHVLLTQYGDEGSVLRDKCLWSDKTADLWPYRFQAPHKFELKGKQVNVKCKV